VSRRTVLWIVFALVHLVVAMLGYFQPSQPMGDVYLVYEPWSSRALSGEGIVGITEKWVYPQLALLPMILTWVFGWLISYTPAWALMVTLCDAAAFALLVGTARSRGRVMAAWFWLAAILLLGPVGLYRLDGVTVPLAIAGSLWLVRRPWLGSALLAVATWMKVWPAALLAAAFVAVRRRWAVVGGALAVSAVTLAAVLVAGGGRYAFGFIADQTGRGLQIEAPVSGYYMWRTMLGDPDSWIYYDPGILTFQVTGPNVDPVIAIMTPLLALAVGAVFVLGAVKVWRGASFATVFPWLSLGLVLAFIVFNKVGSPQYIAWLIAPVVVGFVVQRRMWERPAIAALVIAGLTQLVYPITYDGVRVAEPLSIVILTLRNLALVVLFVWTVVRLSRVPTHGRRRTLRATRAAVAAAG
jgi:hypothetical protein